MISKERLEEFWNLVDNSTVKEIKEKFSVDEIREITGKDIKPRKVCECLLKMN